MPRKSICSHCKQPVPPEAQITRLNVEMDTAVYTKLKARAISEGLTLSGVVRKMTDTYLASHRSRATAREEAHA